MMKAVGLNMNEPCKGEGWEKTSSKIIKYVNPHTLYFEAWKEHILGISPKLLYGEMINLCNITLECGTCSKYKQVPKIDIHLQVVVVRRCCDSLIYTPIRLILETRIIFKSLIIGKKKLEK